MCIKKPFFLLFFPVISWFFVSASLASGSLLCSFHHFVFLPSGKTIKYPYEIIVAGNRSFVCTLKKKKKKSQPLSFGLFFILKARYRFWIFFRWRKSIRRTSNRKLLYWQAKGYEAIDTITIGVFITLFFMKSCGKYLLLFEATILHSCVVARNSYCLLQLTGCGNIFIGFSLTSEKFWGLFLMNFWM